MELNILKMFMDAGVMVKFVMLCLLVFSIASWYITIKKFFMYRRARQDSVAFLEEFWKCRNLAEAFKSALDANSSPEAAIFKSGYNELQRIRRSQQATQEGTPETLEMRLAGMENLKRALRKSESGETSALAYGLPVLATTGSATPFIGLYGTVWGIMTSFHEIGQRGSASLAAVAPGISEALVATAAGLAVAIPATIFYNYYSHKVTQFETDMQSFSSDFLNLVERDLIARSSR